MMQLSIECPECGYNKYKAKVTKDGSAITLHIGECPSGGCDISGDSKQPENEFNYHFDDFSELKSFVDRNFQLIEVIKTECFDDN